MKPNEVMIGDWVEPDQCMVPTMYTRVAMIMPDGVYMEEAERQFDFEELHPIHLAPEILENNGWKSYSHEKKPIYGIIQGFEITLAYMDYYWQLCVDGTIYRKIKINYVHELQHAMHLMRLHDMADNFKVKGGNQ